MALGGQIQSGGELDEGLRWRENLSPHRLKEPVLTRRLLTLERSWIFAEARNHRNTPGSMLETGDARGAQSGEARSHRPVRPETHA